jgi:hypothetical protein
MDRILMLGASPSNEDPLPIREELALLKIRLPIRSNGLATVSPNSTANVHAEELTSLLQDEDYDILHIVGHGTRKAYTAAGGQSEESVPVEPGHFVNVLKQRVNPIRLVVLAACFSGDWIDAFLEVAHAVVAMPAETYAYSAREFSIGLYENLYSGMSLSDAVSNGILAMRSVGDAETQPIVRTRGESSPETTYLFREPELFARFKTEPPSFWKERDGTLNYSIVMYLHLVPTSTIDVRLALFLEENRKKWIFWLIEREGEDYEETFDCWGNAEACVLIEHAGGLTALRSDVVSMLERHYERIDHKYERKVKEAIELLRRDGRRETKNAKGKILPRGVRASKMRSTAG